MSSKLVILKDSYGFGLYRREWDGIDKPDYIWIRRLEFDEACDLAREGVTDLFGHVREALKNPLDELAKLGQSPSLNVAQGVEKLDFLDGENAATGADSRRHDHEGPAVEIEPNKVDS